MIKADKHSIAGFFIAIISVAVISSSTILSPILANCFGNVPRELRLGTELGLLEAKQCQNKYLNKNITKKEFGTKVAIMMTMIGVQDCKLKNLLSNGIVTNSALNSFVTRKEAIETLCRATIYMGNTNIFNLPENTVKNYKDYKVKEKYAKALGYLQSKFVVRGISNDYIGANKKLTNREAVYFLYRLYEAISSDVMTTVPNEGLCFIDVPLDHPIMDSIRDLTAAGAFDRAILRPSFDGNSYMVQDDLSEIIGGIFDRSGKDCDMVRLQAIFSDKQEFTTRRQMALVLEFLIDSFSYDKYNSSRVYYKDVKQNTPEYQALSKLAYYNINPGYENKFAPNENVTWFESVNLINQTLKQIGVTSNNQKDNMNAPADKEDFERLKNILIDKKAKIRSILGAKKNSKDYRSY